MSGFAVFHLIVFGFSAGLSLCAMLYGRPLKVILFNAAASAVNGAIALGYLL